MNQQKLEELRTRYLVAIGRTWLPGEGPTFRQSLVHGDGTQTGEDIFYTMDGLPSVPSDKRPFHIKFLEEGPTWDPTAPLGWNGPLCRLKVPLPPAPGYLDNGVPHFYQDSWGLALAQYYRLYGTLSDSNLNNNNNQTLGILSSNQPAIVSASEFVVFGAMVQRAVAQMWNEIATSLRDQSLSQQQLSDWYSGLSAVSTNNDPLRFTKLLLSQDPNQVQSAFTEYLKYLVPWNIEITFEVNAKAWCWDETTKSWNDPNDERKATVTLRPPLPPTDPGSPFIQPLALAQYNNNGAAYPFTCM